LIGGKILHILVLSTGDKPTTKEDKMKTLNLTIHKKWFDIILSGEKKEEYRDVKPYYTKRFFKCRIGCNNKKFYGDCEELVNSKCEKTFPCYKCEFGLKNKFTEIIFRNGYKDNSPKITIELKEITVGKGSPNLGAPEKDVFILKLGDIIKTENLKGAQSDG
jgi:hypothetical protein